MRWRDARGERKRERWEETDGDMCSGGRSGVVNAGLSW